MPDKARERWYVERLQTALPDFPLGDIHSSETPDFTVDTQRGLLGIEVTVLHLPPPSGKRPHQEQQSLKDHVVALANRRHAEEGGPALYVWVHFREPVSITKSRAPMCLLMRLPEP
jgi:hypothetical protein